MQKIAGLIGYNGKTFKLSSNPPSRLDSYWDGGSRDYFYFYSPAEDKMLTVHSNHPAFEPDQPSTLKELPPDLILIEHSYFCGKDHGLTFYVHPDNLAKYLPKSTAEITELEIAILKVTRSLKNTYAGQSEIRYNHVREEFSITFQQYREVQNRLYSKGLLRKNFSITPDGRNAIADRY